MKNVRNNGNSLVQCHSTNHCRGLMWSEIHNSVLHIENIKSIVTCRALFTYSYTHTASNISHKLCNFVDILKYILVSFTIHGWQTLPVCVWNTKKMKWNERSNRININLHEMNKNGWEKKSLLIRSIFSNDITSLWHKIVGCYNEIWKRPWIYEIQTSKFLELIFIFSQYWPTSSMFIEIVYFCNIW